MEIFDADVIVAGAGPAGSSAAYDLASAGIRVLVLEKSHFPRYKVCGAGLTHKTLSEIPYDLAPVIETTIRSVRFSHKFSEVFTRTAPDPIMYCTMRETLDSYMLEKAAGAGAVVIFGQHVTGVEQFSDRVLVTTRDRRFTSRIVIGADGASGLVSRSAGLRRDIEQGLAWEAEIPAPPDLVHALSETVFLDWGTLPGGYAWMFPKKDHLSIGVGGPAGLSPLMAGYYQEFYRLVTPPSPPLITPPSPPLKKGGRQSQATTALRQMGGTSWPIPVRRRKGPFHNGRVMVAGDAAGLTDPMTGEGIWYAVKSGRMAAHASREFLEGRAVSLAPYSEEVNTTLMEDLSEAIRIRDLFNAVPRKIHLLVRDNDRVWRAFGKILRGERFYSDVKRGFGKWRFLWGVATKVAGGVYFFREKSTSRRVSKPTGPLVH
jgi:geranylgeranyl reductase family protein